MMSSVLSICLPDITSSSGIFGVMMSASGKSLSIRVFAAFSSSSLLPLVATITGSRTMFFALYFTSPAAIASIVSTDDVIPIFTASGKISVKTAFICASIKSAGTFITASTPMVFCAVSAVMTLSPNTPFASMVFKSACTPAPPLESLPAIVSAVCIFTLLSTECCHFS